jgi:hypothetical protein
MKINTRKKIRKNTRKHKTRKTRVIQIVCATRRRGDKKATQSRKRKMAG